jgi:hypothetical protein
MKYVRSTDHGRTWQSSETLTGERWNIAPQTRTDNMNEVYIGQLRHEPAGRGRPERVAIVYTPAPSGRASRRSRSPAPSSASRSSTDTATRPGSSSPAAAAPARPADVADGDIYVAGAPPVRNPEGQEL